MTDCRALRWLAFPTLLVVFTLVGAAALTAETFPVTLRNVSGHPVDFALGDSPVWTGSSWVVIQNWKTKIVRVKLNQYLFYRYTDATKSWRHYPLGKYADDIPGWRFTPGGSYFPNLQKDPTGFYNINGAWKMGGPYNVGMPCKIIQKGTILTFINENGNQAMGYFKDANTVVAVEWRNLIGDITADKKRINWHNKTWWVR